MIAYRPDFQALIERAAGLQFDNGLTRSEAESQAIGEHLDRWPANCLYSGLVGELASAVRVKHDPRVEPVLRAIALLTVRAPAWGLGWVMPEGDTYRPAAAGEMGPNALIVPAFEGGELIDLVAECFASRQLLPRTGAATMVGHEAVESARNLKKPLFVFDRPSAWLRGHCLGVVILDWNVGFELEGVLRIACKVSLADKLYEATRRCWPRPIITIPTTVGSSLASTA